jgi:hypothetical protein
VINLKSNPYFLSATNPIATVDQRDIEDTAMRVFLRPEVQQARTQAAFMWATAMGAVSDEAQALFEAAMDEYTFNYVIKAVNSDANHPRVVQNFMPRRTWFGREIRGARLGGDNPDNGYRLIPVEHGAAYEVRGRIVGHPPADVTYTIVANNSTSKTLSSLDGRDVQVDAEGNFVITIDDEPAGARQNHIQNKRGAKWLYVRDSLGDWVQEKPNALTVRRLTPPTADPISEAEMGWRAANIIVEDVPITYWFTRIDVGAPPNRMTQPRSTGNVGGLVSQVNSVSLLRLADDEAFVITLNDGGASYRNLVVHDWWYRSIEYWRITSSLNSAQMLPNDDGTFTCVVSVKDPGVHNWIDTGGLHEVHTLQRWQGVAREMAPGQAATIEGKLSTLKDVPRLLPKGAPTVTAAERRKQLEERQAAFMNRLLDR